MSRLTSRLLHAVVLGQLIAQLGWIDPLFIPLVLAGPLLTGAILATRRVGLPWVAALWVSTGLGMTWSDWLVNREDVGFHLALAVVMPLLAGVGWGAVRWAQLRSAPAPASDAADAAVRSGGGGRRRRSRP